MYEVFTMNTNKVRGTNIAIVQLFERITFQWRWCVQYEENAFSAGDQIQHGIWNMQPRNSTSPIDETRQRFENEKHTALVFYLYDNFHFTHIKYRHTYKTVKPPERKNNVLCARI